MDAFEHAAPSADALSHIEAVFTEALHAIVNEAGKALSLDRVNIIAASLPHFWPECVTQMFLKIARSLDISIDGDLVFSHEDTARLAYNLGCKSNKDSWFLVLVDYNDADLSLSFTEIDDHEGNTVRGQYRIEAQGEHTLKDVASDVHYTNISRILTTFITKHTKRVFDTGPMDARLNLNHFPYSNIKAVVLTGDASDSGMKSMRDLLNNHFWDLPQRREGPVLTNLHPKAVGALGAARAVRASDVNDDPIDDVVAALKLD